MKKTSIGSRIQALAAEHDALLKERSARLAHLHTDLGFGSKEELVKALSVDISTATPAVRERKKAVRKTKPVARKRSAPKAKKVSPVALKPAVEEVEKNRKNRVQITAELRESIVTALGTGRTDIAIAKEFGVSRPTVQNIKRAAGLTRSRSKDTEGIAAQAAALVDAATPPPTEVIAAAS
jgi:DNA-binding NarL/FixJ family response regulator